MTSEPIPPPGTKTIFMKRFNIMFNVGKSKYVVNYHDGCKKHNDGSDFFDIAIFSNKKSFADFQKELLKNGYTN